MKKLLLKSLLAPALLFAVACDQSPMEPVAPAADQALRVSATSFLLETTEGLTGLLWEEPLKEDIEVSEEIDQDGGSVFVKPGIELRIPEDALGDEVDITILSRAGEDVAFEFGPHGLQFKRPVAVRIHLSALANSQDILRSAKMAYYSGAADDASRIKLGSITAIYYVHEDGKLVEALQTFDVFVVDGKYLEFETDHFSGYALAA